MLVTIAPGPMPLCMKDVIFVMKYLSFALKNKNKNQGTTELYVK